MCFSAEADLVAGVVVTAIGADALRQVRRPAERALGALPVLLGAHLLIEVPVWLWLTGDIDPSIGRQAMWLYLAVALVVLPVFVPLAVRAVEPDPGRRRTMGHLAMVGAALAGVYLLGLLHAPVDVEIVGSHLAYRLGMDYGGLLAGVYAVVACAPPMLSSERRIAAFGVANLAAVVVLVWVESSALTSLWCAWAALTSVAIAAHLRRADRHEEVRIHVA
ncbi:MAG TPA: DUF6629 family protein [Acidimicrobiales bacterium]|nr:DUF6629 family protein [Acidimicrobiales bacterium]